MFGQHDNFSEDEEDEVNPFTGQKVNKSMAGLGGSGMFGGGGGAGGGAGGMFGGAGGMFGGMGDMIQQ